MTLIIFFNVSRVYTTPQVTAVHRHQRIFFGRVQPPMPTNFMSERALSRYILNEPIEKKFGCQ